MGCGWGNCVISVSLCDYVADGAGRSIPDYLCSYAMIDKPIKYIKTHVNLPDINFRKDLEFSYCDITRFLSFLKAVHYVSS